MLYSYRVVRKTGKAIGGTDSVCQVYSREVLQQKGVRRRETLLDVLLRDRTTQRNLIWATSDYAEYGPGYTFKDEICAPLISGEHADFIQPRVAKAAQAQHSRTKMKAEVFTPAWVCNAQINLIDNTWFGQDYVFNEPDTPSERSWHPTTGKIEFPNRKKRTWKHYVDARRMEITCGEAPYLVSRYDAVNGEQIPIESRIGFLDRKLRIVGENTETEEDWITWAYRAFQSTYGFEYQGDSLFLARENLFATYIEYFYARYGRMPEILWLYRIATVISWNLWQMDGLKCVVPESCYTTKITEKSLFGEETFEEPCPGCKTGDRFLHNGIYCIIRDWRSQKNVPFISILKGGGHRANV